MKFSYSIPITTIFVLVSTIIINILGLKFSLEKHFPIYIDQILERAQTEIFLDPNDIRAIASMQQLDSDTQEDYDTALTELSQISDSLKSLSKNPELYVSDTKHNENISGFQLPSEVLEIPTTLDAQTNNTLFLSLFSHPFSFDNNSPEGVFVYAIMKNFLWLNAVWIVFIMLVYMLLIRRVFHPIHLIIERVQNFSHKKSQEPLKYHKKDEFLPLVTELNTLYSSLEHQENIRNQFLADLSHELRTPMTAISCMLEAINDGILELNTLSISTLQKEITRLVNITEKILKSENFLNSVETHTEKTNFSLMEATEEIVSQYQGQLSKTGQKIFTKIKKSIKIFASKEQYIQVLHNIFSNFYKYAWENTTLYVTHTENENEHILTFADNGKWVKTDQLPYIREKFFRSDTGRNQNNHEVSMGIGFSMIEKIVSLHGGVMLIANNQPSGLKIILTFSK